ncbi:MAG: T9SS type A sorting domain-containing protein [Ignavibacteria bacterium]|nr:T9SS type A sorting domain-containing protein [Ignavibacteria bacterium]
MAVSDSSIWNAYIVKYTESETHVNPQLSSSSNNGIDQPLFLSPNPVKDNSLNIAFKLLTPEQVTIEITNTLGEVISVVKSNELFPQGDHSSNVDISNFPAGAYFCILRYKDKVYQQQFIRY